MARRKKAALRRNLLQILALLIAVAVVVAAVLLFQRWWDSRPGPEPRDITVTARAGATELTVEPYLACEVGADCPEPDEVPELAAGGADEVRVSVPGDVSDYDWTVLAIYTDPAANTTFHHGPKEASEARVPMAGTAADDGEAPRLTVVEVSALLVGHDDAGAEIPMRTVWSVQITGAPAGK